MDMGNRPAGGAGASLDDNDAMKSLNGMWQLALINGFSYKTEPSSYWTSKMGQHVMYPRDAIRDKSDTCLNLSIWTEKSWREAMSGSHIIVDVTEYQSDGIVPPESPQLPADVVKKWGITPRNTENGNDQGGDNENGGDDMSTYSGHGLSFQYPSNWNPPGDYGKYVYLTNQDGSFKFMSYVRSGLQGSGL